MNENVNKRNEKKTKIDKESMCPTTIVQKCVEFMNKSVTQGFFK